MHKITSFEIMGQGLLIGLSISSVHKLAIRRCQVLPIILYLPDYSCQSFNPLRKTRFFSPRKTQPEVIFKYVLTVQRVPMDLKR